MRSGPLDQRVTLLAPVHTSSTQSGQGVATFASAGSFSASVTSMNGSEVLAASSIGSHVTYEVGMRFLAAVTPKYRLRWTPFRGTAKTLEVHTVQIGTRTEDRMTLLCGVVE
jgi:SPP1 family predicted phage head-tail adaptor